MFAPLSSLASASLWYPWNMFTDVWMMAQRVDVAFWIIFIGSW
jgi:hypothetical protein